MIVLAPDKYCAGVLVVSLNLRAQVVCLAEVLLFLSVVELE